MRLPFVTEAACRTLQQKDPATFASTFGKGKDAFGKCVSSKASAAAQAQNQATINAAKSCRKLQKTDAATFASKFGTAKNAFGKCVAATTKTSP